MIYYFSGTGNTRYSATLLARLLHIKAIDIRQWLLSPIPLPDSFSDYPSIGFAFPVYGWGLPIAVETFLTHLPLLKEDQSTYVFALLCCGDDIGYTHHQLRKLLAQKGYSLSAVWSLRMPNTYTALPFFDIDNPELAEEKVRDAEALLPLIAQKIMDREQDVVEVVEGSIPGLKSGIIRKFFNRFLISPRLFYTDHRCTACQRCVQVCPLKNITVVDAKGGPEWGDTCTFCLACYHICPLHNILVHPAGTGKKGRVCHRL